MTNHSYFGALAMTLLPLKQRIFGVSTENLELEFSLYRVVSRENNADLAGTLVAVAAVVVKHLWRNIVLDTSNGVYRRCSHTKEVGPKFILLRADQGW